MAASYLPFPRNKHSGPSALHAHIQTNTYTYIYAYHNIQIVFLNKRSKPREPFPECWRNTSIPLAMRSELSPCASLPFLLYFQPHSAPRATSAFSASARVWSGSGGEQSQRQCNATDQESGHHMPPAFALSSCSLFCLPLFLSPSPSLLFT